MHIAQIRKAQPRCILILALKTLFFGRTPKSTQINTDFKDC